MRAENLNQGNSDAVDFELVRAIPNIAPAGQAGQAAGSARFFSAALLVLKPALRRGKLSGGENLPLRLHGESIDSLESKDLAFFV